MNLTLKPELTEFIQQEILTGKYASPDEVIEAALNLLKSKSEIDKERRQFNSLAAIWDNNEDDVYAQLH